jgi:hypothetical protein
MPVLLFALQQTKKENKSKWKMKITVSVKLIAYLEKEMS